ncbi:hypothetical protein TNCV_2226981 [Trichonephila clavipes]|uniref:Uncharacterized protein n=1 Tax=Trichonephila clavipes TaxID=2585209 RepID=A0A8X6WEK8_TRICX|nr:hypothetical protein TNCV_2226981 [Trichonephila clavipes]
MSIIVHVSAEYDLGSNPGDDMDVCKYIVPTLNSCRAACPLVCLVAGDGRWETPDPLHDVLPQNSGGTVLNRIVTCLVLKATSNDKRTSSPLPR